MLQIFPEVYMCGWISGGLLLNLGRLLLCVGLWLAESSEVGDGCGGREGDEVGGLGDREGRMEDSTLVSERKRERWPRAVPCAMLNENWKRFRVQH